MDPGTAMSSLTLLPPSMFVAHRRKCSKDGCDKCFWSSTGPKLRRRCLIPGTKTPWLACAALPKVKKDGKAKKLELRLGCMVCWKFLQRTESQETPKDFRETWGKFANPLSSYSDKSNSKCDYRTIYGHSKRRTHQQAVQAYADSKGDQKTQQHFGPSIDSWQASLSELRKGRSARNGDGGSDQKTLIRWCLSEAVLRKRKKKLQTCRGMILLRDERHGQLMVRYRACLRDFSVLSGLLGIVQLKRGKSAEHLVEATQQIMEIFCTDCHAPPRSFRGSTRNQEDKELAHTLQSKVHMVVTDCASSELLAQDIARGTRSFSTMAVEQDVDGGRAPPQLFPNCLLIGRDRAHATCRLLEKPWKAETQLHSLMERTITGKNSIAQKIWNSHTWTSWLEEAIVNSPRPRGTRLCAAKHRFASYSTPLTRFILHLEPMVLTLNRIAASGVDAGWATEWLESVTVSDLLLLSMAADMAQCAIELTRYFDKEDMDIAVMNERVYQFCFELQAVPMFVGG